MRLLWVAVVSFGDCSTDVSDCTILRMELLPKEEAADRIRRMQAWMRSAGTDAVFVLQNADQYYFAGTVQVGLFCLLAEGNPVYLVQKSETRARMESPWETILPLASLRKVPDLLASEGLKHPKRIGLELDVLPASYYLRFQELYPHTGFVDASEAIRKTRMVKSQYEVEQMRRAARILETAFAEIPAWMQAGRTELEISARLEGFLRLQGHQGLVRMRGFNHEIAYGAVSAGPSACYPTSFPGPVGFIGLYPAVPNGASLRKLAAGDPLMVDVCGGFGGYIADKTRVFVMGEAASDLRAAHAFVLGMCREIEALLRPGIPCSAVYQRAIEQVKDSPYAEAFMGVGDSRVRFIGHGVGLELDELPVLAPGFDFPLEPGMTIAVEPKIFFPSRGGVGIENTYHITGNGFEKLTRFEEEIIQSQ